MNLVPFLVVGTVFLFANRSSKNAREKAQKALPAPTAHFGPDNLPDVIEVDAGESFGLAVPEGPGQWRLMATPPGEIVILRSETTAHEGHVDLSFDAVESGEGSIVLHLVAREGDVPPEDILEIKIKVKG